LRAAAVLVLLASAAASTAQAILDYEAVEPRTFGYVLGDKIRRELRFRVRSGYRLDTASLPRAGRLDRWLELAEPELRVESAGNGRRYRLVLTYQVLNAPRSPAAVTIPQQDLRLVGEGPAVTTLMPSLEITVAPLTSALGPKELSGSALQPDRRPAPLPVEARQARLAWTGTALLALLLFAAWRRSYTAAIARRNLPFANALRRLKRLPAADAPADPETGLRIVHEALNRTAGRAVFAHNLEEFLAQRPEFASLRGDFARLFVASGRVFFADAATGAEARSELSALRDLCRRGSRIERRLSPEKTRPGRGRSLAAGQSG
jgi:mxaA protein